MRLGYNTNGLAHHRLTDAITLLAELGYQSAAITLDAGALDPFQDPIELARQAVLVRSTLEKHNLSCVVETGARYLLNPWVKHDPTLMDPDPVRRQVRADFLCRAIDIARQLGAECVSFWSGKLADAIAEEPAMRRLAEALVPVLAHAERTGTLLAFEPEPGMFIDTMDRFAVLENRVNHPLFQLTLDVGHVHCVEATSVAEQILRWGPRIVNIHIEDMKKGIHEHLMFGEGTMDFPSIFQALRRVGYSRGVHVELSRHSHEGATAARRALRFLLPLI